MTLLSAPVELAEGPEAVARLADLLRGRPGPP